MSQSKGEEKPIKLEDILQSDVWDVDEDPHIIVDSEKCLECPTKPCIYLCPAGCYVKAGDRVIFSYEGCVECGTCRVICPMDAVKWNYPKSGKGILYRFA
ncbi:MAG: 4Fe-4S dicluster domain-containing protein [Caldisphaeraceae archaeon]|nr:4Fe-4S dicluster domain-containing protein [Caldisphaeraceae archaeon]MEB2793636.1 4Fe-4S dicluster domain-containing protein [Caldisphaeraceae archaeon]MEB3692295.1 4Fe-4S dicluster domain-containing protein [Caldisphaeraceae archaeon]MEB3798282.1 4Fe-4S dicluster domain-containing protein [Caldisphaeraceae archaeon]